MRLLKAPKGEKIQIELMFIFRWSSLLPLLDFVQTEPSFWVGNILSNIFCVPITHTSLIV